MSMVPNVLGLGDEWVQKPFPNSILNFLHLGVNFWDLCLEHDQCDGTEMPAPVRCQISLTKSK